MKLDKRASPPVAHYLRPEEAVVPFRTRPELDELKSWCGSGGHAAVRLVTGDGGAGKTRLALRFGKELTTKGWQLLWVWRGLEPDAVRAAHMAGKPCMLVVDYAETRRKLVDLLDAVAADRDGPDLRVVLLARSEGEWWYTLHDTAESRTRYLLDAQVPIALGPVFATGGPQEVFDDAVTAFAREMRTRRPEAKLILSDADPVVLVVHAAALLAVVNYATGTRLQGQAASGPEMLNALLQHEEHYWAGSAASRGLDLDPSVLRLAVALGSLIGAESETAAGELLSRIPDLDSAERRGRVARWLHDLYPTARKSDAQPQEWLGPLQPDRLAEQHIANQLAMHPELIAAWFAGLKEARAAQALTVLARAALTQDHAVTLLRDALVADLDRLAVPALSVAVRTNPVLGELLSEIIPEQPVSQETLRRVAEKSPSPSFALAKPAAVVLQRLADDSTDDSERAGWLVHLSGRLADLDRQEEALAAIERATGIYRQLAKVRPHGFRSELAVSLNSQSMRLADLGRRGEALAAAEEAVSIYRPLAEKLPGAYQPKLVDVLHTQSYRLAELGRRPEALAAIEEVVHIYGPLAEKLPGAYQPKLADILNSQSMRLADLGRHPEALAAAEEAVRIYRPRADDLPDAFRSKLADVLHTQSYRLAELGRREEALAAIEEVVRIYRPLADARPNAFRRDLAGSLKSQSDRLADSGRREEALAAAEEAVRIYRQLIDARPDAFRPKLADVLDTQSYRLAELGRREEALAAIEEAVRIYRPLADELPDAFRPDLAISLNSQSMRLADLGRREEALGRREEALKRREEALAAADEAVHIYRPLADEFRGVFPPKLADVLHTQSYRLAELGRREEALAAIEEAVRIYRPLAGELPDTFSPKLADVLHTLSNRLAELGRREEALAAADEAVHIYRPLADEFRGVFSPKLADVLHTQSYRLAELGRREEALAAIEEAVRIYRPLAGELPDAFSPKLADVLHTLSNRLAELGRREEALAAAEEAVASTSR